VQQALLDWLMIAAHGSVALRWSVFLLLVSHLGEIVDLLVPES